MPERRTQSYAAVPREVHDNPWVSGEVVDALFPPEDPRLRQEIFGGIVDPLDARRMIGSTVARAYTTDPEFEPELPPSPTFWPRDEPKDPGR